MPLFGSVRAAGMSRLRIVMYRHSFPPSMIHPESWSSHIQPFRYRSMTFYAIWATCYACAESQCIHTPFISIPRWVSLQQWPLKQSLSKTQGLGCWGEVGTRAPMSLRTWQPLTSIWIKVRHLPFFADKIRASFLSFQELGSLSSTAPFVKQRQESRGPDS